MPNQTAAPQPTGGGAGGDAKGYQWVNLTDFTPGCYNNNLNLPGITPQDNYDSIVPAPVGSADPKGTFNCLAMPQGGLAPLPICVDSTIPHPAGKRATPTGRVAITGFLLNHATPNNDEIIWVEEYPSNVPDYQLAVFAYDNAHTTWHYIWNESLVYSSAFQYAAGACNLFITRVALTDPTSTIGQPVVVIPWALPAGITSASTNGHVLLYPNPNTPTAYGCLDINDPGSGGPGLFISSGFGHQNRIFVLTLQKYPHPITTGTAYIETNEEISFTDPPNSTTWQDQNTSLVAEDPFGYSAVGSISAGELFMLKAKGGGVVVQGDIVNPNVTFLPGVEPGGIIQQGLQSTEQGQDGLYYISEFRGAWVWNGSNTANKISGQLVDDFYTVGVHGDETYTTPAQTYSIKRWGDWVLFSNNWLYDTVTHSWWPFQPQDGSNVFFFWYDTSHDNQTLYMAPHSYDPTSSDAVIYEMVRQGVAQHYKWTSNIIQLDGNKRSNIRTVLVRYSLPSEVSGGGGTITITLTNQDGVPTTDTITIAPGMYSQEIQTARLNMASNGSTYSVAVEVNIQSSGDPTLIQSISLGYNLRQSIGANS